MSNVSMIISGGVLGYNDVNPLPTNYNMVDMYNKRAINTSMYGHNDILAMIDRFNTNNQAKFTPMDDSELDKLSPFDMAMEDIKLTKRGIAEPVSNSIDTQLNKNINAEPVEADVASVMAMLNDCALNV